jgi:hypothetical protein
MRKASKVGIIVGIILAIVFLSAIGYFSIPFDATKEVWLPEKYSWANNRLPVKEVFLSGTAVIIPLEEYKQRFSEAESILILSSGARVTIYYLTKQEGITYCAKKDYGCWVEGLTNLEKVEMISDAEIYLSYQPNYWISGILVGITVMLSVAAGALTYASFPKSPKSH